MERKLYRSRSNRVFWGVCGGFGEFFGIDTVIVRVITVLITVFTGFFPGLIAYFIIALIIPVKDSTASTPEQAIKENIADIRDASQNLGQNVRSSFANHSSEKTTPAATSPDFHKPGTATLVLFILGIILVGIGLFFIMGNIFHWLWTISFPAFLIAAGIIIILVVVAKKH
jgi:phage shock protein C